MELLCLFAQLWYQHLNWRSCVKLTISKYFFRFHSLVSFFSISAQWSSGRDVQLPDSDPDRASRGRNGGRELGQADRTCAAQNKTCPLSTVQPRRTTTTPGGDGTKAQQVKVLRHTEPGCSAVQFATFNWDSKLGFDYISFVHIFLLYLTESCVWFPSIRDIYRCARSSDWGDQVPIIPEVDDVDDDIQTDSEWRFSEKLSKETHSSDFWNNENCRQRTHRLQKLSVSLLELLKYWLTSIKKYFTQLYCVPLSTNHYPFIVITMFGQ